MADTKLSALAALAAAPDAADLLLIVDVSDTSMAASGTDKKITAANLALGPAVAGTDFTPTLVAGITITKTVTYARFLRVGRFIFANAQLAITQIGTASTAVTVGLPVTAATGPTANGTIGTFSYLRAGVTLFSGTAAQASTTTVVGNRHGETAGAIGVDPAFTTASGDIVAYSVMYEAAA